MAGKRVSIQLISIGSELMRGACRDDNAPFLLRELAKLGLCASSVSLAADFPLPFLAKTIRKGFRESALLILSGGLGPTEDDTTRQAVAQALGRKLFFSRSLFRGIERRFKKRGMPMPGINERQAYLPRGASPIPNPLGSAPGILLEVGKKILIVLPGVPTELQAMFERTVRPYLKKRFPGLRPSRAILFRTAGLAESRVNELLEGLIRREKKVTFGFYAHAGIVDVEIRLGGRSPREEKRLRPLAKEIRRRLGPFLFCEGDRTLEEVVFRLLEKKRKTVSVAESCTGGTLSGELTKIPGSSRHFRMGVVAYSNSAKTSLIKVPHQLIRKYGAVSEPVAASLARQARRLGRTDFGLGVTGILGPGGGTKKKPVGLVYLALASPQGLILRKGIFLGDRETNRVRVVRAALDLLRQALLGGKR